MVGVMSMRSRRGDESSPFAVMGGTRVTRIDSFSSPLSAPLLETFDVSPEFRLIAGIFTPLALVITRPIYCTHAGHDYLGNSL